MKATTNEFKAQAFYCVSQLGGYAIEVSNDGSMARVRADFGEPNITKHPRWQEIKFNKAGDPFVTFNGRRMKLDNFLRVY